MKVKAPCKVCGAKLTMTVSQVKDGPIRVTRICKKCGYSTVGFVLKGASPIAMPAKEEVLNQNLAGSKGRVKVKDLLQPFNKDGKPNYDFLKTYGDRALTPKQRERARSMF